MKALEQWIISKGQNSQLDWQNLQVSLLFISMILTVARHVHTNKLT